MSFAEGEAQTQSRHPYPLRVFENAARSLRRGTPQFETPAPALYNLGRTTVPEDVPNPQPKPRRWSIIAAGLLLLALALVVLYTTRAAFSSPLALVVIAAIGLAALLLQIRLRKDLPSRIHSPLGLNAVGLICAIAAVFADHLHLSSALMLTAALGAVLCFGISGAKILHNLRKK
ncbi:MAG TPA: hypothetical protein VGS78_00555 [Candidatus Sulfotelmatobacter sp.]|nr:hypothetical protein [Candidatus Sulfotelmatobacter sp.]